MQFGVEGETVTLRLERNTDIDTNIAFTFAGDKGRKVYIPDRQDIGFYQDQTYGAAISVTAKKGMTGIYHKFLEGSFILNETHYDIQPPAKMTSEQEYQDGVPHRIQKVEMPEEYDDMVASQYEQFAGEMNDTIMPDGTAKQRRKRDTTVDSYYVELEFVLDHTIYN
ncbi:hypothetical protein NP493_451g02000 [Ridgeia piscesae]|uniref:Uncharacterized protein n=1 Tax=Ridgeia piscesae TaxID=27915 RepID=A0AAD9NRP4_RIDPI|nr:hypothetical protein NP493_451g02000 [Ridgeia piscesae]